ncbi:nuclear transport factor 2 family protein [Agrobacterium rhizogenes]|jgi:ketosteroid isomerase-like protein|nr:nuclear transport factor 2 family protein [Rhizobium rhizogenes]NTJ77673.1 nuclear transport factor 2 family protein [Rhizobium rhizogenes]
MTPDDVLRLYEEKLASHHFEDLAPLISAEAIFWFPNGTHNGIKEIQAALERTWQRLRNDRYWLEDVRWIVVGEIAATCIYKYRWEAEIEGRSFKGQGRGTAILNKEDRDWKIVHEHLSRFPN